MEKIIYICDNCKKECEEHYWAKIPVIAYVQSPWKHDFEKSSGAMESHTETTIKTINLQVCRECAEKISNAVAEIFYNEQEKRKIKTE